MVFETDTANCSGVADGVGEAKEGLRFLSFGVEVFEMFEVFEVLREWTLRQGEELAFTLPT